MPELQDMSYRRLIPSLFEHLHSSIEHDSTGVESFPTRRIISTREDRQLEMQRSETERTARGESTPKARGGRKQR